MEIEILERNEHQVHLRCKVKLDEGSSLNLLGVTACKVKQMVRGRKQQAVSVLCENKRNNEVILYNLKMGGIYEVELHCNAAHSTSLTAETRFAAGELLRTFSFSC